MKSKHILRPGFEKSGSSTLKKHIFPKNKNVFFNSAWTADPETRIAIAKRLKKLYGQAEILFTIRGQVEAIQSAYDSGGSRSRAAGRSGTHIPLEKWLRVNYENWIQGDFQQFDYYPIIELYGYLFGKDHIHIFPLEELQQFPRRYSARMACLLGLKVGYVYATLCDKHENERDSHRVQMYNRFRSRVLPSLHLQDYLPIWAMDKFDYFLRKGRSSNTKLSTGWQALLINKYQNGNVKLNEQYNLKLGQYKGKYFV